MRILPLSARRRGGAIALIAWFALMLVGGAGLLAKHIVALPGPAKDEKLGASLATLRGPADQGRWLAVHALYADCRCSQRVVDHLVATSRPAGWSEIVLWVGNQPPSPALEQRFDVRRIGTADLGRYGIEAAPILVVLDPSSHVRYAGGYTDRKQGPVIDDLRILEAARHPDIVASLPVFGCAISDRLTRQLALFPVP